MSCWLNFGAALLAVRIANGGGGAWPGGVEAQMRGEAVCGGAAAKLALARLLQGMMSWHHLQHCTLPAVAAAAVRGGRQRERDTDVGGLQALVAMGWEEGAKAPAWLLARSLVMLPAIPAAFLPAILEVCVVCV